MLEFIPTNANNCRLQSITSERIIPELKAAIKCVHEYKYDTQLLIEGKDLDEDVISDYLLRILRATACWQWETRN